MTYHDTNRAMRNRLLTNTQLREAVALFRSKGAAFIPGSGNLGDALIQLGTFDYFADLQWSPEIIVGLSSELLAGRSAVILGGGGGWIEGRYTYYPEVLTPFLDRGGELLILPTTFWGFEGFFRRYAGQITVFAREQPSFDALSGIEGLRLHLADDMAFATNVNRLVDDAVAAPFQSIKVLRRDGEAISDQTPMESIDLPIVFNNTQWTSAEKCLAPLLAAAGTLRLFESIETDRLHMAILSAMIGRKVTFRDNSYFKNRGVFERTLSAYDGVQMVVRDDLAPEPPPAPDVNYADRARLLERIDFLTSQLQMSRRRNAWLIARRPTDADRAAPTVSDQMLASSFVGSRGYRVWKAYIRMYEHPVLGRPMKVARRFAGRLGRIVRGRH